MAIQYHPGQGAVVIVDFDQGFKTPEMVKRRPALVICPQIATRPGLCTVVALSTTAPNLVMPYHAEITLPFKLPAPYDSETMWIKGDMVNSVGFHRIDLLRLPKDKSGARRYLTTPVGPELLRTAHHCLLKSLGLASLTRTS